MLLDWVLVATGSLYLAAIIWLHLGLWRVRRQRRRRVRGVPSAAGAESVSVIVAARDEEASLPRCLQALRGQEYEGALEIIVVDDRSRDDTANVVRQFARDWPALRLVQVVELKMHCPKKNALAHGIEHSRGDLLLFTDADCVPSPQWVRSTVGAFDDSVGMVAGYAAAPAGRRWVQQLLALDNLAVAAMGAGSMGMGAPLSCSGRNLAYRRRVFDEVGGYSSVGHLVGGDDVYMMRLVRRQTSWAIVYNADPQAGVISEAGSGTAVEVVHQKLRHASKAARYAGPARLLGIGVYLFHLSILIGLCMVATGAATAGGFVVIAVWSLRWLADGSLMWHFASRFTPDEVSWLRFLPAFEIGYLPYVLLGVPLGALGMFRWKGSTTLGHSTSLEGRKAVM
jgi:cellulose synthase/poly-beta-1,6-N-acetylglucosamine synthase-like glycosyltransferase